MKRLFAWAASAALALALNTYTASAQQVVHRSSCDDVVFNIRRQVDMYGRRDIVYEWKLNDPEFLSAYVREIYFLNGQRVGTFVSSYEGGDDVSFAFVYPLMPEISTREVSVDIYPPQETPVDMYTSLLFDIEDQSGSYSFRCLSDLYRYEDLEETFLPYNPVWLTIVYKSE